VQIVATVDSAWKEPVSIQVPGNVTVDQATPASRTLPPIRPTLEHLLMLYKTAEVKTAGVPWEMQLAPTVGREQMAEDLQAYLEAGIPPQGITWLVRTPDNFSGRFPVTVQTAGGAAEIDVTVGDAAPPSAASVAGNGPIRSIKAVYPKPTTEAAFFRPFSWINADSAMGKRLASFDLGWVWLYVLVYLPALLIARAILKVA
jgi:hypothetical protein